MKKVSQHISLVPCRSRLGGVVLVEPVPKADALRFGICSQREVARDVEVVDAGRVIHGEPLEVHHRLVLHRGCWVPKQLQKKIKFAQLCAY